MSETNKALENLADAYLKRGKHQEAVRAKYANMQRELDEAKQRDIDDVAQVLVAAWHTGATVSATGRAMGTTNIYGARRAYYERARVLQGEMSSDDNELLNRLYRKARGEETPGTMQETAQLIVDSGVYEDETTVGEKVTPLDLREWVNSWTLDKRGGDTIKVNDPQGRVESIRMGLIHGFKGENMTEFLKDKELADLVSEVHGIETKVMA